MVGRVAHAKSSDPATRSPPKNLKRAPGTFRELIRCSGTISVEKVFKKLFKGKLFVYRINQHENEHQFISAV